ncbi:MULTISPECIES: Na+/H+ antiporter NhaC [Gammaproteobacteria]|uniref:Na+/H+ antiporter NhaC n=1 Tax=Gammaproteobacteria TaxID=1236 RepID=UPI000DCFC5D5|nr:MULTISPECIES: Na+/H+ antiporter NhaC [Gammaproteobacteria]RTE87212.1 Na+/H+ antiporter NhaC [Aliidiomarina sp. B3213]TCZ93000.1 Na+/H+ antiporter NhaC [Lysobacter sp. N42]
MTENKKAPNYLQALIPLIGLILMLGSSVYLFGEDSSYGGNQIALLCSAAIAALISFRNGYTWQEVEQGIVDGISVALGAVLIILMVGSLIGTWLLSGIVPAMIYYGLEILDPSWFYAASCVICAIIALAIGSSWTTAATIGVALIGVAMGMGMSVEITAGAIISGAYFGDKMSPLSDTTNLAPAVSGTELFAHIRYMSWTSFPAIILSVILFTILGFGAESAADLSKLESMQTELATIFNISPIILFPLLILFALAIMKKPALPTIFIGALVGAVWAVIFQPDLIQTLARSGSSSIVGGFEVVWLALATGVEINASNDDLTSLISGGGMGSMVNTVWLIISAMTFGAVMETTGLLQKLIEGILKSVKTTGNLILSTILTGFGTNLLTADQYMAIVLPGRMFRNAYKKQGLDPRVLSRSLESSGTVTSALIPWNTCGAYMFSVLGVYPLAYAPYAFFLVIVPLLAIIYGYTNFKILRLEPEHQ